MIYNHTHILAGEKKKKDNFLIATGKEEKDWLLNSASVDENRFQWLDVRIVCCSLQQHTVVPITVETVKISILHHLTRHICSGLKCSMLDTGHLLLSKRLLVECLASVEFPSQIHEPLQNTTKSKREVSCSNKVLMEQTLSDNATLFTTIVSLNSRWLSLWL